MDAGVRSERFPGKMTAPLGESSHSLCKNSRWDVLPVPAGVLVTALLIPGGHSAQLSIQTASEDGRNCLLNSNHALGCLESFLEHIHHGRRWCHEGRMNSGQVHYCFVS